MIFEKDSDRIVEKPTPNLSFIEQLQNQIQLCREAISDTAIRLTPRVEALESLLWAKLKDDKEYLQTTEQLKFLLDKTRESIKKNNPNLIEWQIKEALIPYRRHKAKEQFKAIMIFIDKKNLMPLGEQNG